MGRIVDLSMAIQTGHFRWPVERRLTRQFGNGDVSQITWAGWSVHAFTHMDAARHFDAAGATTSDIALEQVIGEAAVLDLRGVTENSEIGADTLEAAGSHLRPGDIALLSTGWDVRASIQNEGFWTRAPFVGETGANWLRDRGVKAVGFDFPQDYCIRHFVTGEREPLREENTTHMILLLNGIVMFEYLCNLGAIKRPRVMFFGLPLKLPDADGAPARVIAIED